MDKIFFQFPRQGLNFLVGGLCCAFCSGVFSGQQRTQDLPVVTNKAIARSPPTHALSPARPPLAPSPDVAPARLRGRHRPALRPRRRGLSRAARRPGASVKIRRRLQKKADTTTMTALLDAKATRGERGADPGTAADLARLQSELGGCRNSTEELAAQLRGCAAHPSGPCIHRAQQQWRSRLPTGGEVRVRQRHTNHTGARPRCLAAAVEQKVASRRRQTQRRASTMKEIGQVGGSTARDMGDVPGGHCWRTTS